MIVTVTLNVDFAYVLATDVSPTSHKWTDIVGRDRVASGKGVNAARIIAALGGDVVASGLVGADSFTEFSNIVKSYGVTPKFVTVDAPTRSSIYVLPREGTPGGFRQPGLTKCSKEDLAELLVELRELLQPGDWVLLGGSAPSGDASLWFDVGEVARDAGAKLAWDAYGESMHDALLRLKPEIIKLNEKEIEMTFGKSLEGVEALNAAASLEPEIAIVTIGGGGSLMSAGDQRWKAWCPNDHRTIEIGAGDSFAGGLLNGLVTKEFLPKEAFKYASAVASMYVDGTLLADFDTTLDSYLSRVTLDEM